MNLKKLLAAFCISLTLCTPASASLLTSLIFCLELEEAGSASRADATGTVTNFTDNGGVTQFTGGNAKVGNAAGFSGGPYLTHAATTALNTNQVSGHTTDFTFAGWVYLTDKSGTHTIISKASSVGEEYTIVYDVTSDRFKFRIGTNAVVDIVTANNFGSPSISTWYFVFCTFTSATDILTISINAGTRNSITGMDNYAADLTSPVYVGDYGLVLGVIAFNGREDQLCFWKRVLDTTEEASMYNSGSGRSFAGMAPVSNTTLFSVGSGGGAVGRGGSIQ